jgi:hypothetical protein
MTGRVAWYSVILVSAVGMGGGLGKQRESVETALAETLQLPAEFFLVLRECRSTLVDLRPGLDGFREGTGERAGRQPPFTMRCKAKGRMVECDRWEKPGGEERRDPAADSLRAIAELERYSISVETEPGASVVWLQDVTGGYRFLAIAPGVGAAVSIDLLGGAAPDPGATGIGASTCRGNLVTDQTRLSRE